MQSWTTLVVVHKFAYSLLEFESYLLLLTILTSKNLQFILHPFQCSRSFMKSVNFSQHYRINKFTFILRFVLKPIYVCQFVYLVQYRGNILSDIISVTPKGHNCMRLIFWQLKDFMKSMFIFFFWKTNFYFFKLVWRIQFKNWLV